MKRILFFLLLLPAFSFAQLCADEDTVRANAVTLITYNSARVNGTTGHFAGTVLSISLKYVRVGQTDTATSTSAGTNALRNITGLQANTLYVYYYISTCGSGTVKQSVAYTFTTLANTVNYTPMAAMGYQFKYLKADSGLMAPRRDTTIGRAPNYGGQIVWKPEDSTFYGYNGEYWHALAIDSAGIITLLNDKVDSVTVAGDSLWYWKQGVSYGYILPTQANEWKLLGNAGTTAGTNFVGTTDAVDLVFKRNSVESGRFSASGNLNLGLTGTTLGSLGLSGNTSGLITVKGQAAAGTYNFNLPTTAGTSGYLLTSAGGGASPMTWTNPSSIVGVNIYNSDGTITGDRTVDGGGFVLQFNNISDYKINDATNIQFSSGSANYQTSGTFNIENLHTGGTPTINIKPAEGALYIDTLTNVVGTHALRYNPTTGLVSYADTTAGGGGSSTWNSITSPTADQALTFDAGESSTWTDANTTEDLFTVNSSTGTTNSMFSLNRTGTALASGNNILELVSSGANGTNAITATGARISVTNTNATSGTNVGLAVTATGATTANYAIQATGAVVPGTNDGSAIGNTALQWSDLFLAEGGVINWDNGDATLTQVGNNVTLDGAAFIVTSPQQTPASFSSSFAGNMQVNWNSTTSNNVNFVFQKAGTPTWYIGNNASVDRLHILNSAAAEVVTVLQGQQVGINKTAPTARLHIGAGLATASYAPLKFTTGTNNTTAEAGAMEYTTPQLFFTNGRAVRQEIFQGQQSRVSTQYDNTTTTLGNVTGLTANVAASGTYRFEAKLYTTSDVAGGIKVAIGGTATATAIRYEGLTTDAGLTTQGRATALGTAVGAVTAVTAAYVVITGTITVNAAGTITVQAAANAATGTTSVLTGSTFVITEML